MLFLYLAGYVAVAPVLAAIDERYKLLVGTSVADYNSNIKINSKDDSVDGGIDLEDDVGLDSTVKTLAITGYYRVGDNHRLRLTYLPIRRSTSRTSTKDIIIDNTTIKSGAVISLDSSVDIFDFSYVYSVYKKPQIEVGVSFGLYWLSTDYKFFAAGNVQADGDTTPAFKADYQTKLNLEAPLPLIGIEVDYEFTTALRVKAALRYLSLTIGQIDGEIMSAAFGTEYYFSNNWGVGASLAYFSLNVESSGVVFNNSLEWAHNDLLIFGIFKY